MANLIKKLVFVLLLMLCCWRAFAVDGNAVDVKPTAKAAVILCKGMIDDGLYKSIRRRSQTALDNGADYLIYEISTYGGLVKSADDISKYLILDIAKKAHTVAYITTEAISAGAMISVSCRDIIMLENTTIGDCAPLVMGGKLEGTEREKTESFIRATFKRAAEMNGYPTALLTAMVSMHKKVYRVKNIETNGYEFFESEQLPTDPNKYGLDDKELVVGDTEILTLTASKAFDYGIARVKVENIEGALDFLAARDGVVFVGSPVVFKTMWSEEMVRWINSPAVMGVLVMLAMLGAYMEFNTPGLGLPGLVAVICFVVIIGSKYLVGLANWVEVAVFVLGLLFLLIEIFLIPGFGVAGFLGLTFMLAGVFGMLVKNPPGKLPWPQTSFDWKVFVDGLAGMSLGFAGFLVLAFLLTKYLPKLQFLSGLILAPVKRADIMHVNMTTPHKAEDTPLRVGNAGVVLSPLRPAGQAKFADSLVNVVAQAEFIEKGVRVEIIEIHGNRVVVKKAE